MHLSNAAPTGQTNIHDSQTAIAKYIARKKSWLKNSLHLEQQLI